MGMMVDLGEITSQDPGPWKKRVTSILVEEKFISYSIVYKTLSYIR